VVVDIVTRNDIIIFTGGEEMTLKKFGELCREDDRLAVLWDRMMCSATKVISNELGNIFTYGVVGLDTQSDRQEFNRAQIALVAECIRRKVPFPADLSIKKFLDVLSENQ
jgi:hypothetical protein